MFTRWNSRFTTIVLYFVCYVTARPSTELKIGGSIPMSVRTEGQVTVLMLILGSGPDIEVGQGGGGQTCVVLCGDTHANASQTSVKNCRDVQRLGHTSSGVYTIRPYDCCPETTVDVFCDMDTDGGGWTVIQRRDKYDTQENFFRTWQEYEQGFGNLTREFWLGLEHIHALTNQSEYEARFDFGDFEGSTRFAKYSTFHVDDKAHFYQIKVQGYTGDAGNAMDHHDGRKFTTKDADHDELSENCAVVYSGAWWYGKCHNSNLNGQYYEGLTGLNSQGIIWEYWKGNGYSLKKTEIKIRPKA